MQLEEQIKPTFHHHCWAQIVSDELEELILKIGYPKRIISPTLQEVADWLETHHRVYVDYEWCYEDFRWIGMIVCGNETFIVDVGRGSLLNMEALLIEAIGML